MKTNELRAKVKQMLSSVCDRVYYEFADENAMYPHLVFTMDQQRNTADPCVNVTIDIDVWGKRGITSVVEIEDLCDSIEKLFETKNHPLAESLPTFYLESTLAVIDEDKKIIHRVVRVTAQTYERK